MGYTLEDDYFRVNVDDRSSLYFRVSTEYFINIPVRRILIPPVVPPLPIGNVVGFELMFRAIF